MARRLGAVAAGVAIVSGTFTGAALANPLPGVPLPNIPVQDGGQQSGGFLSGLSSLVGGGDTGDQSGSSNAQTCAALSRSQDQQNGNIQKQAAATNGARSRGEAQQGAQRLNLMGQRAGALHNTMTQLGCNYTGPLIDIGTLISNPCIITNGNNASGTNGAGGTNNSNGGNGAGVTSGTANQTYNPNQANNPAQANSANQTATGSCTYDYSRNSASGLNTATTTPTTTTTALSTLGTVDPALATATPLSQIAGNAVPVGGVNTGGSEGP